jgi:nucleotide-binding universal stress UspA family protein
MFYSQRSFRPARRAARGTQGGSCLAQIHCLQDQMYEHLLVALDGSEAAEQVLQHAEALAGSFKSTITLLRAIVSAETLLAQSAAGPSVGEVAPPMDPTPVIEAEEESAEEYLGGIERRLRQKGLTVNSEHPEGPASDVIVERARELGVSLILMTTHGRGGLGRLVFGSTADSVLRHAECPVLLVRVHDQT